MKGIIVWMQVLDDAGHPVYPERIVMTRVAEPGQAMKEDEFHYDGESITFGPSDRRRKFDIICG